MKNNNTTYHKAVLLEESVAGLDIRPDGTYIDATFGGGGHSRFILSKLGENGRLYAFDQDEDAKKNAIDDPRFTLITANFRFAKRFLRVYGVQKVDGILADLGVSSHQFDEKDRGFSIRFDGKLDMRMDTSSKLTAHTVVNSYEEKKLADVLYQYGELRNSRLIARKIVSIRKEKPIETSFDLRNVLQSFLPKQRENKVLAQIFQAIRIEVNQEMDALKEFLEETLNLLKDNGRLSIISYHSLEDRLVKRFIKNGMFEGEPEKDFYGNIEVPLKKVGKLIVPTSEEIQENNRARSAKLRIATKIG
ncbi:MAG: 16S rRNA (cytosine(1402)-N(4))-methyltransferase RsmH [Flavobacteriaceae bacterium]|nr:16S rRNA (cytosine(1402)-N(4))-methyltransferase RsmH [Flavobacteriaceae bacterium]